MTTMLAVAALGCAAPAGAGGPVLIKDGRYAGGAKHLFVFFSVEGRTVPFARVDSERLSSCAVDGPAVFDSDPIDSHGRFTLRDNTTFATEDIKIKGRFVAPTRVKGKVVWDTTSACPTGRYEFKFTADRYGPAG